MIDYKGINAAALPVLDSLLAEWFPSGRRIGNEYVLGNINGEPGRSLSINVRTGKWADFSDGSKGGDPISLFAAAFHANSQKDAAADLSKKLGLMNKSDTVKQKPTPTWKSLDPPEDCVHPNLSGFSTIYPYRNTNGDVTRYVCRKDAGPGRKKSFTPSTWGSIDGAPPGWHWKHPNEPRCLYGLDRLASMPGKTAIVCEGEKAADAAQEMLPDYPCVSWSMGAGNVLANDWDMLSGHRVILWPDNDIEGHAAMEKLRPVLAKIAISVETLNVSDLSDGADAADISTEDPVRWIMERLHAPSDEKCDDIPESTARPIPPRDAVRQDGILPLGHDRGTYFYFSNATGQVEAIPAAQHSRAMLKHLASEAHYWQRTRFAGEKGVDWHAAADDLMVQSRARGIFRPECLRGKGAWLDRGRSVLHLGDHVILDGAQSDLMIGHSDYIYEQSASLDMELGEPLTTAEANQLRELCIAAPWEAPDHMGQLLAGWCVIAPVCGAMPWRPHLWITSEGGGGKSWVLDNIIKPSIGPIALEVQSKTTEAGIRQTLGCDARPVIFDEAETQNETDRARIQHVLDLARQASSEDGAAIIKGSANGKAMQYHIRSCFAFSSINVGMSQSADESRTVVLTLQPDKVAATRVAAFTKLKALHAKTITPGFAGRLLARTLSLLPTIRINAVVFAEAIARSGKARRTGDTYGVMMAGAWSLRSTKVATSKEADRLVAETQWVKDAVVGADAEPEWQKALGTLASYTVRFTNANGRREEVPLGEMVSICAGSHNESGMNPEDARLALSRAGIRVHGGQLVIANRSSACAEAFAQTPWATSWKSTISRADGAVRDQGPFRFASGLSKGMAIPIAAMET